MLWHWQWLLQWNLSNSSPFNSSIRSIRYFFVGPARIPFFGVHFCESILIRHRLICQYAQLVSSFYPWVAFCSTNASFAVSLLMLVASLTCLGIPTNFGSLSEKTSTSQVVFRGAKRDPTPIERTREVFKI